MISCLFWIFLEMKIIEGNKDPIDIQDVNLLKNVSKDRLNGLHPCQLPFELIRRFVEVKLQTQGYCFRSFAGTFSTSLVASSTDRNSIGIEINPKYVKLGNIKNEIIMKMNQSSKLKNDILKIISNCELYKIYCY